MSEGKGGRERKEKLALKKQLEMIALSDSGSVSGQREGKI